MTQTVAITGATGFIGRRICSQLLQAGCRVRALVRTPRKASELLPEKVELVKGSLADAGCLETLVDGADAVVHCAGAVRGATREQFDRVNVDGVRMLLRTLESQQAPPRLLSLSSLAAREPELSHYAASKRMGEQVLSNEAGRVRWIALRPPAVYGPGDTELLPLFRAMAKGFAPVPGAPDARFSMLFVDDLAAAVQAWLHSDTLGSGVYSLEDGRVGGYDWQAVADTVTGICNRRVRLIPVPAWMLDIVARINSLAARMIGYAPMLTPEKLRELRHPDWVCDSKALQAGLDWRPQYQLEAGLRATPGWSGHSRKEGEA
jgi:nucleoside-diphosphate-sugar epimerase